VNNKELQMKIAIYTQVRENYGSADAPYWKFKGGDTYIVPDLSVEQTLKVKENGIPTLKALIESKNAGFEEYVIDYAVFDNDAVVCEEWETPFELRWVSGRWVATRTVENGEYGYMRSEVERKTEDYDMLMGGERENYRAVYTMRNGDIVHGHEVESYLNGIH
jgi:hypothetical protein